MIVNKNGVFIDTHVRYRTISDNLSKQEYKFLLTTTLTISAIGKNNPEAIQSSIAYKALVRIAAVYDLEGGLKDLSPEERLKERQKSIKPLLEEFFAWIHEIKSDQTVLPRGETAKGINYCLNQEKYLKVFLGDGEVPIDNLASERALRTFTIGRKNWMTLNTVRGAQASAIEYSVAAKPSVRKNGNHLSG